MDYVPSCLPEKKKKEKKKKKRKKKNNKKRKKKKKAPTLQFGLFCWVSAITAYMVTKTPE